MYMPAIIIKKSVGVFTGKAGVLELIFISYDTSCFETLECVFEAKLLFEHDKKNSSPDPDA